MSKYIRTNDGRIIDTTKERETKLCNQRAWCPKKGFVVYENDIIKQADTIEELVDMWVAKRYVMDEPCHWVYISKDQMKKDISLSNKAYTIYGSIWVDDNLIKVAKMNDKGELELL